MLGRQHPRNSYKSSEIKHDSSVRSDKGFLGEGRSIASSNTSELQVLFPDAGSSSTPVIFSFTFFSCAEPQSSFSPWLLGTSFVLHTRLRSVRVSEPSSWKSLFASQNWTEGDWTALSSWWQLADLDPCMEWITSEKYEDSDFLPFDFGLAYRIKTMSQANSQWHSQMYSSKKNNGREKETKHKGWDLTHILKLYHRAILKSNIRGLEGQKLLNSSHILASCSTKLLVLFISGLLSFQAPIPFHFCMGEKILKDVTKM